MPGIIKDEPEGDDVKLAPQPEEGQTEGYVVVKQEVTLEVNFREKSLQGESKISLYVLNDRDPPEEVALDARQCEIDTNNITVNGQKVLATYRDPYEALTIPKEWDLTPANYSIWKERMKPLTPDRRYDLRLDNREQEGCVPADGSLRVSLRPDSSRLKLRVPSLAPTAIPTSTSTTSETTKGLYEVVIPFRTTNIRDGLQFVGVEDIDTRFPHMYTRHSPEPGTAACIFPCVDDPGSRSLWKIHIKCPRTLGDALKQPLASQQQQQQQQSSNGVADCDANASINGVSKSKQGGCELVLTEEEKLLDMTVICSGNLVGEKTDETDETKKIMSFEILDHPAAAQHIGFAVGPFQHVNLWSDFRSEETDEKLGTSALKIHGYCLPGREDQVRNSCEALAQAADEFAMAYGKYPYDSFKICFVDDMDVDTVPLLSFSLCSNRLLFPEDIIDPEMEVTRKLVHCLAYQYFGVYIVPNQRTETWLTVGIAYYITDLYLCKLCGTNDYRFRMKTMADRLIEEDRGRPSLHDLGNYLHLGGFEMDFMALKAPLVLFILDKRLSKAAGSAGASLARVISKIISKANTSGWGESKNEIISSDIFRRVCERTSQYKLEAFWAQWVYGSGCPWLQITQKFNKKRLCVEIMMKETQDVNASKPRPIPRSEFWREVVEELHHVYAGEVQRLFTGPMTIRIHEANGTPYEHIVDIREDAINGVKFDIPYNTKYKRLKRNRKHRERAAAAAAADPNGEHQEEVIVFSLGDKLETPKDVEKWELADWSEMDEKQMDTESYEWLRIDSDFEWIFKIHTNLQPWMYTSQLQQDRDVVAQQDTLLYLAKLKEHPMSATILTRTLYDDRYYHGIRTMAASILARQTWKATDANGVENNRIVYRGMTQLMRIFRESFCYPDSTPRPNDFSDKRQYLVKCAIVEAIGNVNFEGRHPPEAQKFLLDLLRFNNNSTNPYSDHFYVAKLLDALATSLCSAPPKKARAEMSLSFDDAEGDSDSDEEMVDADSQNLLQEALAEIERYRRMDEWTGSYQNIWTRAALDCKRKLMKAGIIPVSGLDFVVYLVDGTLDLVQIKAFEALVDLGLMLRPTIMKLMLTFMRTHSSPYMRSTLFRLFCEGLAAIAFGEQNARKEPEESRKQIDGLIVEQGDEVVEQHQAAQARKEDITVAMAALKAALKDNVELSEAMWKTLQSPITGCAEKRNMLDLFEVVFEEDRALLLTIKWPTKWTVTRPVPNKAVLEFKAIPVPLKETEAKRDSVPAPAAALSAPATASTPALPALAPGGQSGPAAAQASVPAVAAIMATSPADRKPSVPRIKLQTSRSSLSGPSALAAAATASPATAPAGTASRHASISVASPAARTALPSAPAPAPVPAPAVADSIAVHPVQRTPSISQASSRPPATPAKEGTAVSKSASKRKREDRDDGASPRTRKVVKLRLSSGYERKFKEPVRRWIESTATSSSRGSHGVNSKTGGGASGGSRAGGGGGGSGNDVIRAAAPVSSSSGTTRLVIPPLRNAGGPSSSSFSGSGFGSSSSSKPARKPLPSSARHESPSAGVGAGSAARAGAAARPAPSTNTNGSSHGSGNGGGGGSAPSPAATPAPKFKIKIKTKPSSQS